jgi:hypothetical protein
VSGATASNDLEAGILEQVTFPHSGEAPDVAAGPRFDV